MYVTGVLKKIRVGEKNIWMNNIQKFPDLLKIIKKKDPKTQQMPSAKNMEKKSYWGAS